MTDVDEQRKTSTGNPLTDLPVAEQKTVSVAFEPKRLREGAADVGLLSQFLTYLLTIEASKDPTHPEQGDRIPLSFSSLLKATYISQVSELRFTNRSAFEGDPPQTFLFTSEVALIFYDLITSLDLKETLNDVFEKFSPNNDGSLGKLIDLTREASTISGKTLISEAEERLLGELFTTSNIHVISRFFLTYLARQKEEKPEEEKLEVSEQAGAQVAKPVSEQPTAGVPGQAAKETKTEGGGGEATAQPEAGGQAPQPIDVLELKQQLFSPELREQAARFTQIGLVQLERFHNLPEGSLQNSVELREILAQKSLSFFTTVLSEGRLNTLLTSPEERFKFAREYIWLIQNDLRTTAAITEHLSDVVLKGADPATKQKIEAELVKAEQGQDVSPLIQGLAEDPGVREVVEKLEGASPAFRQTADQYLSEIDKELLQRLKDIGVQTDKLGLAQTNTANVVDAMISMGLPIDVLKYIDEPRWRTMFSDDVPYRAEFVQEFLAEYWQARQATLGKKFGELLINDQSRFAIQEAVELLNKNNPQISEKDSDTVLNQGVIKPLGDILVAHRELGAVPVETTLEAAYSRDASVLKERYQQYLSQLWEALALERKARALAILGYGEATSQEVVNLAESVEFIPPQLGILNLTTIVGNYDQNQQEFQSDSEFIPQGAKSRSPLGGVRGLLGQVDKWKGFSGIAKRLGKGLGGKAGDKAIGEIAGTGLAAGVSAIPGGQALAPFAKWLGSQLATKEGRQKVALVSLGTLGALIIPLSTVGGWLGSILGGIAGWFLGGPVGVVLGAIGGGWTGFGIEQAIKNALGGGSGSAALQGGGGGLFGRGGGGGAGGPTAAGALLPKAAGPVAAVAATGTQAVLATIGLVAGGTIFTNMVINNALLADFPQVDPLATSVPGGQGKISDYVTIEKRVFVTGCPDNKCDNPAFPIKAEYSIVIKPKGTYSISLHSVTDTLRVNSSKKAWEDKGKAVPNIPERVKTIEDFPELYQGQTINSGEQVAFSYTESFDEQYNDASILNTFEIDFSYTDPSSGKSGDDKAITGEVIYVGDYSQGAGCWPTNGTISQLPNGGFTHHGVDAFDISNVEGTPVHAPFTGTLCVGHISPNYGNHLMLEAPEGTFLFGHFSRMIINSGCQPATAGQVIGYIGNTGNSTGAHLHFELRGNHVNPSLLATLMPDGPALKENDPVRTCYDEDTP